MIHKEKNLEFYPKFPELPPPPSRGAHLRRADPGKTHRRIPVSSSSSSSAYPCRFSLNSFRFLVRMFVMIRWRCRYCRGSLAGSRWASRPASCQNSSGGGRLAVPWRSITEAIDWSAFLRDNEGHDWRKTLRKKKFRREKKSLFEKTGEQKLVFFTKFEILIFYSIKIEQLQFFRSMRKNGQKNCKRFFFCKKKKKKIL